MDPTTTWQRALRRIDIDTRRRVVALSAMVIADSHQVYGTNNTFPHVTTGPSDHLNIPRQKVYRALIRGLQGLHRQWMELGQHDTTFHAAHEGDPSSKGWYTISLSADGTLGSYFYWEQQLSSLIYSRVFEPHELSDPHEMQSWRDLRRQLILRR